jgi:hypothetical protein
MTNHERVKAAVDLYVRLIDIIGGAKAPRLPFDLDVLSDIYEQSDADWRILEAFVTRVEQRFASYLSCEDAAVRLGSTPAAVRRLVAKGVFERVSRRGKAIISRKAVERYIEAQNK